MRFLQEKLTMTNASYILIGIIEFILGIIFGLLLSKVLL